MGWWKLEAWKEDSKGNDIELDDADLEHIAEAITDGYTQGEVVDGEEENLNTELKEVNERD